MSAARPLPRVPFRDARGRMLDLANLQPADIHFPTIAYALARLNRYAGNTAVPISVAQHSLIAMKCAIARGRAWAAPWVLLHDAHEAFIGDITTPAAMLLFFASANAALVDQAIINAKRGLDDAIYHAARLPAPRQCSVPLNGIIHRADRDAYLVELRDFHRGLRRDDPDFEAMTAIGTIMPRQQRPLSAVDAEIIFMAALENHLPCYGAPAPALPAA